LLVVGIWLRLFPELYNWGKEEKLTSESTHPETKT
jgi:hypothetical protein